jgi:DNA processing protein
MCLRLLLMLYIYESIGYYKLMEYFEIDRAAINWPKSLQDLGKQEPKQLWYEGVWDLGIFGKCACVVGSRRMTEYGRRVIEKLVPKLVDDGWTVVSGMMYGVDQVVHQTCMSCGGRTIAVLGWGIKNKLVSDQEIKLTQKIIETGGLMISEWEEQAGTLWTFPRRDRIMAALASGIYVIEAAEKSGSLITADWGIKLKRNIWAVPGPVTSRVSQGTNQLISQGLAKMWTPGVNDSIRHTNMTDLYTLLQNETLTIDEMAKKTNRAVADLAAELTLMSLKGEVVEKQGKYYVVEV